MPLPIDQLLQEQTEEQVLQSFIDILVASGIPADKWRKAGTARTILRVVARTYAGFTHVMSQFIRFGFLETAEDKWLTELAFFVYGVTRVEATFATGELTLTNSGGGLYTLTAGTYQVRNPDTGKVYTNVAGFTINPSETLTIDIVAVETGSASSSPPDTITEQVTQLLGVSVTNAASVIGTDQQSDVDLRQECKSKLGALSLRGPRGAYEYAVRSALRLDSSPVDINRFSVQPDPDTGVVDVYVASPSGPPTTEDVDAVTANIEAVARPDTVTVNVIAATPVGLVGSYTVWVKRTDGLSASDVEDQVNDALDAAISLYPIGGIKKPPSTSGYLYGDFIVSTIMSANTAIFDVDGADSDILLAAGEVAVLNATLDVRIVEAFG